MAEISLVKEWCDKEGIEHPSYSFSGFGTNWVCIVEEEWLDKSVSSDNCTSKKAAKQDVAEQLWNKLAEIKKRHYSLKEKTLVLIDGDQRVDCWTFLADKNNTFENLNVCVVIGATSYAVESDFCVIRTKTTSKDSADAKILMILGSHLHGSRKDYQKILIVSADHILVQAAMDYDGVDWVSNVKDLKKYLESNSI